MVQQHVAAKNSFAVFADQGTLKSIFFTSTPHALVSALQPLWMACSMYTGVVEDPWKCRSFGSCEYSIPSLLVICTVQNIAWWCTRGKCYRFVADVGDNPLDFTDVIHRQTFLWKKCSLWSSNFHMLSHDTALLSHFICSYGVSHTGGVAVE